MAVEMATQQDVLDKFIAAGGSSSGVSDPTQCVTKSNLVNAVIPAGQPTLSLDNRNDFKDNELIPIPDILFEQALSYTLEFDIAPNAYGDTNYISDYLFIVDQSLDHSYKTPIHSHKIENGKDTILDVYINSTPYLDTQFFTSYSDTLGNNTYRVLEQNQTNDTLCARCCLVELKQAESGKKIYIFAYQRYTIRQMFSTQTTLDCSEVSWIAADFFLVGPGGDSGHRTGSYGYSPGGAGSGGECVSKFDVRNIARVSYTQSGDNAAVTISNKNGDVIASLTARKGNNGENSIPDTFDKFVRVNAEGYDRLGRSDAIGKIDNIVYDKRGNSLGNITGYTAEHPLRITCGVPEFDERFNPRHAAGGASFSEAEPATSFEEGSGNDNKYPSSMSAAWLRGGGGYGGGASGTYDADIKGGDGCLVMRYFPSYVFHINKTYKFCWGDDSSRIVNATSAPYRETDIVPLLNEISSYAIKPYDESDILPYYAHIVYGGAWLTHATGSVEFKYHCKENPTDQPRVAIVEYEQDSTNMKIYLVIQQDPHK